MTEGLLEEEKNAKAHPHVFLGSEKHTYENSVTLLNRIQFFMLKNSNPLNEAKIETFCCRLLRSHFNGYISVNVTFVFSKVLTRFNVSH